MISELRVLVIDCEYMGDIMMSSAGYVEVLKNFPQAELLTRRESRELGHRWFRCVHTSWKTVGDIHMAIHFNINRNINLQMFLRRIPIRVGYAYVRPGFSLQIASRCLNVPIPIDHWTTTKGYRLDEVCDLLERAFGWKPVRKMVW